MSTDIKKLIEQQKAFFSTGQTRDIHFRISTLKKLKENILDRNEDIVDALFKDFNKPAFETWTSEIMCITDEIKMAVKNLKSWATPKRVKTPLMLFKAKSRIYYEPYGLALVIGAWNYPLQLVINPMIGAIAAGNCCIAKPSELTPHTSRLTAEIIKECFAEEHCAVVEGDVKVSTALLDEKFDIIHFTGSTRVGKIVAEAAARHLTPTILELGGKSPCIVDNTADIKVAARRIVWGKFFNGGQTCVGVDYLLVHADIKEKLMREVINCINEFYGENPEKNPDFCRVINKSHFSRLASLLNNGQILYGGHTNSEELYIEPTVMDQVSWDDPIMKDEIFGPLLPVLEYTDLSEVITKINDRDKPLALYFFSENKKNIKRVLKETFSGGVCINTTLMHFVNPHLPFGGVGTSGMSSYHGRWSFENFSHKKSVLDKSTKIDFKLIYPPYKDKEKFLKKLV